MAELGAEVDQKPFYFALRVSELARDIFIHDPECGVSWAFERASDFLKHEDGFIESARNK